MDYRELIKTNNPSKGQEFSIFEEQEEVKDFYAKDELVLRDFLREVKEGKKEELYFEDCFVTSKLREELEEYWNKLNVDEVSYLNKHYGYTLYIRKDKVGYVFRIKNDIEGLTWGILE